MNSSSAGQEALNHSPGVASAASIWRLKPDAEVPHALQRLASLVQLGQQRPAWHPGNLFILTAVSPALLESRTSQYTEELATSGTAQWLQNNDKRVFVQIAAQTEVDRLIGLRIVDAALSLHFTNEEEWLGNRILHGIEAFGFRDGTADDAAPWLDRPKPRWLVVQPHAYRSDAFFTDTHADSAEDRAKKRVEIVGRAPALLAEDPNEADADGEPTLRQRVHAHEVAVLENPTSTAPNAPSSRPPHVVSMRQWKQQLLRRGFVTRKNGQDMLLFVALSEHVASIVGALSAFNTNDRLSRYTDAELPALFIVPDGAGALSGEEVAALPQPPGVEPLLHGPDLMSYVISVNDFEYMMELAKLSLSGARGQHARADVLAKFAELHSIVDSTGSKKLDELLLKFQRATNHVNLLAGQYITKS